MSNRIVLPGDYQAECDSSNECFWVDVGYGPPPFADCPRCGRPVTVTYIGKDKP